IDHLVGVYGANRVREGGLQVYTTIDPRLQREAKAAITDTLNLRSDPAAALVAIDPRTGAIRAMNGVTPGKAGNQSNLGIQSPLAPVPSIGLGTLGVSPLEMASAYATLSAGGIYSRPMAITKVVLPNGKTDKTSGWGRPIRKRVIPEGVAYVVTKILEEN